MITVAIHQPCYFPWLGYLHKMANCDVFVFLDTAVRSKSDYVNRVQIKNSGGVQWLTIPLQKAEHEIPINRIGTEVGEKDGRFLNIWQIKHWHLIEAAYRKTPYWDEYKEFIKCFYYDYHRTLDAVTIQSVSLLRGFFNIGCGMFCASDLDIPDVTGSERNLEICKALNADKYLSGVGGRDYNDTGSFLSAGIEIMYSDFQHPYYPQRGEFVEGLSSLDYLFNVGGKYEW